MTKFECAGEGQLLFEMMPPARLNFTKTCDQYEIASVAEA